MRRALRHLGLLAAVALPALLVASAVRSYRAIEAMREVYLRNHASMIAYQLEMSPGGPEGLAELQAHEPGLVGVQMFSAPLSGGSDTRYVNGLLAGHTLYYAFETVVDGRPIYRVYLPVHRQETVTAEPRLGIARLDLSAAEADFLGRDGQRNLIAAVAAAVASLLVLGAYLLAVRRRLERERLAELGEMSAVLAHEIRNPLGTIKGYVQLARERGDRVLEELLDPVIEETERLEKLVSDLLLFARPQQIAPVRVDWTEITARLPQVAAEAAAGRAVSVHVEPAGNLQLETDPHALDQILTNLVRNAAEALTAGGDIRISAERRAGEVIICVEDNGPGLETAARQKAFQPFFTTKTFGTGLGLPISQRLARQLGGKLELEAVEPHGARALLRLAA